MKEDVEMTELALAFPLFDDSGSTSSQRIRHQVKFTMLHFSSWLVLVFPENDMEWEPSEKGFLETPEIKLLVKKCLSLLKWIYIIHLEKIRKYFPLEGLVFPQFSVAWNILKMIKL